MYFSVYEILIESKLDNNSSLYWTTTHHAFMSPHFSINGVNLPTSNETISITSISLPQKNQECHLL